jgi:O-antigen ligase
MTAQLHRPLALPLQKALSVIATAIITLALIVLLSHYVAAVFQPVRWPTRYYFFGMLLIAFFCKQRTAVMLFVFSLPILPDFHLQLEAVLKPPVKYFVGHPGLDVVAGLCIGLWAKRMWLAKKIEPVFEPVNWVLALLVVTLTVSTSIAVARNLQMASLSEVNLVELFNNLVEFKLINFPNNYLPIVDLLSYCFAILAICVLMPILKTFDAQQREEIIFRPLMWSLILSAVWGILQAFTGLGLFQVTLDYRPASFGFGAQGFQPDIHSFAALMLIGTVGIIAFMKNTQKSDVWLGYVCIALCWIALILSKSKATFVFAAVTSLVLLIMSLKSKGFALQKIALVSIAALAGLSFLLLITKNFVWFEYLWQLLAPDNFSRANLNRALAYRPELFRAAWYMFSESPIFGVGQGNFFRLSSHIDISHSLYLFQNGGDNAHNYFLQTLAETGLVGVLAFVLAIGWPFYHVDHFSKIAAPALVMLAIALGNFFSHPLLVRPNLILFAVFLALLYANVDTDTSKSTAASTA